MPKKQHITEEDCGLDFVEPHPEGEHRGYVESFCIQRGGTFSFVSVGLRSSTTNSLVFYQLGPFNIKMWGPKLRKLTDRKQPYGTVGDVMEDLKVLQQEQTEIRFHVEMSHESGRWSTKVCEVFL
jgi:hypothetical protein